jgi:hypothetical protein
MNRKMLLKRKSSAVKEEASVTGKEERCVAGDGERSGVRECSSSVITDKSNSNEVLSRLSNHITIHHEY